MIFLKARHFARIKLLKDMLLMSLRSLSIDFRVIFLQNIIFLKGLFIEKNNTKQEAKFFSKMTAFSKIWSV